MAPKIGFGDIHPLTAWGKFIACVNAVLGLIVFGLLVAIVTAALSPSGFDGSAKIGGSNTLTPPRDGASSFNATDDFLVALARIMADENSPALASKMAESASGMTRIWIEIWVNTRKPEP